MKIKKTGYQSCCGLRPAAKNQSETEVAKQQRNIRSSRCCRYGMGSFKSHVDTYIWQFFQRIEYLLRVEVYSHVWKLSTFCFFSTIDNLLTGPPEKIQIDVKNIFHC